MEHCGAAAHLRTCLTQLAQQPFQQRLGAQAARAALQDAQQLPVRRHVDLAVASADRLCIIRASAASVRCCERGHLAACV